jgi:adenine-specific DNA-methyltransferase
MALNMNNTKLKQIIFKVLKSDDRIWNSPCGVENTQQGKDKTELNQTLLFDLVEKIDEKIIGLFLQKKDLREKFFVKIKDVYVFKTNDFKFFMEENKIDNSYTQYKNKIGLTDGKRFLKDNGEVVLNFPFKDCVLEGGQSTEEGTDTYFEYEEEKTKTVNKEKVTEPAGYKKKQAKRKEIFFNQILAHDEIDRLFDEKALVNWKRFTKDGEQEVKEIKRDEDGTIKENLIIKGNNLLALHSLKKQFAGKIKLIYIDPPYNTGNDGFKYNDNFNHSTWLTFMRNRLEVAKDLLGEDGFIFVQCDDNEQAYLKILMDDKDKLFGKENNRSIIYVETVYANKTLKQDRVFHDQIEQILIYSKTLQSQIIQEYEDYSYDKFCWIVKETGKSQKTITLGNKKVDIFNKENFEIKQIEPSVNGLKEIWASGTILDMNSSGRYFRDYLMKRVKDDGRNILYKVHGIGDDSSDFRYFTGPKKEGATKGKYYQGVPKDKIDIDLAKIKKKSINNFWSMAGDFGNCRSEGSVELKSGKKPEKLLQRIIEIVTDKDDLILDYHLGSGTTCAVAHKMGRQYIGIEQLDYGENDSVIRLKNVIEGDQSGISKAVDWKGGGDFIYFELAKWNEKAKEEIQNCKSLDDLAKLFDTLYEKYFLNYNLKIKEFKEKVIKEENFKKLSLDEQKRMFLTMLDLNQMYVQKTEMADKRFGIDKKDRKLTFEFYNSEK